MPQYMTWPFLPQSVSGITPFTYTNNYTYLEQIAAIRSYLGDLNESLNLFTSQENANYEDLNNQYKALVVQWNDTLGKLDPENVRSMVDGMTSTFQTTKDDITKFVTDQVTAMTKMVDDAMAGITTDPTSGMKYLTLADGTVIPWGGSTVGLATTKIPFGTPVMITGGSNGYPSLAPSDGANIVGIITSP